MSRYIDVDEAITMIALQMPFIIQGFEDNKRTAQRIIGSLPSIDLDDYVPRDFHDKTCEAMAKRHQNEIADMVSVVRCKECKKCYKDTDALTKQTVLICQRYKDEDRWSKVNADDFCSYGERKESE